MDSTVDYIPGGHRFRKALISISADPVTFGHVHLINKALDRADNLVVCLLENPEKMGGYVLPQEDRLRLTEHAVRDFCTDPGRVTVIRSEELLVDVYLRENCDGLIRGIRDDKDLAFEQLQAKYHGIVQPGIEKRFVYLQADPEFRHISSTAVRSLAVHHADVTTMAPLEVQARLWRVMHKQKVIALTGASDLDKSTIGATLLENLREVGLPAHLMHEKDLEESLEKEDSPAGSEWKRRVSLLEETTDEDFGTETESDLWEMTFEHEQRAFRHAMKDRTGVVILVGTWMGQSFKMFPSIHWTNNNAIVVREGDPSKDYNEEILSWKAAIAKDKYGSLIEYETGPGKLVEALSAQVVKLIREGVL
ncbi:MAG: adenylyltransferase/cytidyltransferase family protein [Bacteroidota bacterium]|jgi:pantetheine-phosphate adenylyltransferase